MAAAKKTSSRTKKTSSPKNSEKTSRFDLSSLKSRIKNKFNSRPVFYTLVCVILVLLLAVLGIFFYNKSLFVAGSVNGKMITSPEFYSKLIKASGNDVFDSLIQKSLIKQEAKKKNLTVKESDLNKRVEEIEKSLGSKSAFENALKQNNLSLDDLREQLTIQLLVEKLLGDKIKVSDDDIDKYIAENKESTATMTRSQVSDTIKSSKINAEFEKWYQEIKNKAKINKYF